MFVKSERVKIGNNWRIDDDGFMLVRARVLKEGIFPYRTSEIEGLKEELPVIDVYIPAAEFTPAALKTGEGDPVIVDEHEWRTADNTLKDGLTKGTVAGNLSVDSKGGVVCEFKIYDADTINKIKSGELVEVSAGYEADFVKEDGSFAGMPYGYKQQNIVFNHMLLCHKGEGRCGADVRVFNKKTGVEKMTVKIRYKVGNTDKEVEFSNEDDAKKAEDMAKDLSGAKGAEIDNALEEIKEKKEQIETLNTELEDAKRKVEEYKQKLDEALSPEAQEALAEDILEQREAEDAVIETEVEDEEKEEVRNACKAMNRAERLVHLASHVMNKKGVDIKDWSDDQKIGAFMAIAAEAKAKIGNKKKLVAGAGVVSAKTGNSGLDAKSRMLMFRNKK